MIKYKWLVKRKNEVYIGEVIIVWSKADSFSNQKLLLTLLKCFIAKIYDKWILSVLDNQRIVLIDKVSSKILNCNSYRTNV